MHPQRDHVREVSDPCENIQKLRLDLISAGIRPVFSGRSNSKNRVNYDKQVNMGRDVTEIDARYDELS
jgi:hypothetical protein